MTTTGGDRPSDCGTSGFGSPQPIWDDVDPRYGWTATGSTRESHVSGVPECSLASDEALSLLRAKRTGGPAPVTGPNSGHSSPDSEEATELDTALKTVVSWLRANRPPVMHALLRMLNDKDPQHMSLDRDGSPVELSHYKSQIVEYARELDKVRDELTMTRAELSLLRMDLSCGWDSWLVSELSLILELPGPDWVRQSSNTTKVRHYSEGLAKQVVAEVKRRGARDWRRISRRR